MNLEHDEKDQGAPAGAGGETPSVHAALSAASGTNKGT